MNHIRIKPAVAALIVFVVIASVHVAFSQSKKHFTVKDVPSAVTTAFKNMYPHAVIKGAGKEKENGETMYEIESMDGKIRRDVLFKSDGTVYEVETTIASSSLPGPVKNSIKKSFPKYSIQRAELTAHSSDSSYEVLVKKGNRKYEAVLNADGKILEKKMLGGKKGEENEEEEKSDED